MASNVEFRTGDLAEVLSGPFKRRLSVILQRYEGELWLVAVYYPSKDCFIHSYLDREQLKIIGHLNGV
jgi:hypothetical protein